MRRFNYSAPNVTAIAGGSARTKLCCGRNKSPGCNPIPSSPETCCYLKRAHVSTTTNDFASGRFSANSLLTRETRCTTPTDFISNADNINNVDDCNLLPFELATTLLALCRRRRSGVGFHRPHHCRLLPRRSYCHRVTTTSPSNDLFTLDSAWRPVYVIVCVSAGRALPKAT